MGVRGRRLRRVGRSFNGFREGAEGGGVDIN